MPRITAALTILVALQAHAVADGPRDLAPLVRQTLRAHPNVPGLAGAIVEADGSLSIGAAGLRKVDAPEAFTADDRVHLGSCTKAMTAVFVAQLVEAGTLRYDTTMAQAFPDLAPRMEPGAAAITVEQLLAHRGGLPANVDWARYDAGAGPITAKRRRVVEAALGARPTDGPGTTYAYSNVGYVVLGAIVEAQARQPWEQAIRTRLFAPLQMGSAGFGPPGTRGAVDQPWGHTRRGDALSPSHGDNPPTLGPAGTVHCTVADWSRFIAWTLRAAQGAGAPLLREREALPRLLQLPADGGYAGGWVRTARPWAGGETLTHAGSNTTWYCVAWLAPRRGFAVLAVTNVGGDDASRACDALAAALIAHRSRPAPDAGPAR